MLRSSRTLIILFAASIGLIGCADRSGEPASEPMPSSEPVAAPDEMASVTMTKHNLNTATASEFKTIPGMTDRMVREFNEYRPYASIQQFRREMGKYVSEDVVAGYEEYVFVPVDPNNCDAETLMQIPGIDASVVEEIIATRPFQSPSEFLDTLAPMVTPQQHAAAGAYLVEE